MHNYVRVNKDYGKIFQPNVITWCLPLSPCLWVCILPGDLLPLSVGSFFLLLLSDLHPPCSTGGNRCKQKSHQTKLKWRQHCLLYGSNNCTAWELEMGCQRSTRHLPPYSLGRTSIFLTPTLKLPKSMSTLHPNIRETLPLNECCNKALGQKSGTRIKLVFQDSVAQHQKLITRYECHTLCVCPWSKYCSARSKVSAAILKLVFAVEIMLWTTSQPISFRHFPILLLKPLHFWVPTSLVNLLFEDTPNIVDRRKLRDSKRVHLYAGGAQNGCFCPWSFHIPSFVSVPALAWTQAVWFSFMS